MQKIMINNTKILLSLLVLVTLSACGGGGGGGGGGEEPVVKGKTFTINTSSIVIKRISNDEAVDVDLSAVKSPTLTLKDQG